MPFKWLNFNSVQDVIWSMIYPDAKSPPPPVTTQPKTSPPIPSQTKSSIPKYTPSNSPLDILWYMIYPGKPEVTLPPQVSAPSKSSTVEENTPSEPPPLFALIIGIDEYKSPKIRKLGGAVADAQEIKNYLETSLGVPASQIKTLYNTQATRDAIIKNICDFQTDPRIKNGDPILLFYAGHGGTGETPTDWHAGDNEIQILLSHDAQCEDNGKMIPGILDRTMGVLLEKLAEEKGDNITVIFDCCHSGSLTRNENDRSHLVRGVKLDIKIPPDADKDIWGDIKNIKSTRGTAFDSKFLKSGLSSHVLLAACGAQETAKEDTTGTRGVFTKVLLDTLRTVGAEKLTYKDLVQRLPSLHQQNPQCEGIHQQRILFNSKAPSQDRHVYTVDKKDGKYVLRAGSAHGITKGANFDVYKDRKCAKTDTPLATFKVDDPPDAFETVLSGETRDIGEQVFALQTRAGEEEDLIVHVALDPKLESVFRALAEEIKINKTGQQQVRVVDQIKDAHFDIGLENGSIVFDILHPLVNEHGHRRLPQQIKPDPDYIRAVLRAAAHFNWHLRRPGKDQHLERVVNIELRQLKDGGYDMRTLMPTRSPGGPNLIQEGVVDINVQENKVYGITLTNPTGVDLYVSAFYFDCSDLSIVPYYQPPTSGGKVDPPLRAGQSLAIGYGAGGSRPFKYTLNKGQDLDVGCLKFFISTNHIDLSSIPQASPFGGTRASDQHGDKPPELWWTVLVIITQRRK